MSAQDHRPDEHAWPDRDAALTTVARATPIYFIGDSSALIFRDRVYRYEGRRTRHYVARTAYCPGLRIADFSGADGALNPAVMRALLSENIVVEGADGTLSAYNLSPDLHWRVVATIEGRPRTAPIVVLLCGALDVPQFWLEIGPDRLSAADPQPALDEFAALARRSLVAFTRGLATLKSWGLERVFVQSIMPPPLEGDTIAAHFSVQASLHVRSGSIRILNGLLAEVCAQTGNVFIDTWDATERGGGLRDEFAHDMFHLNEAAAFISVEQVARAVDEL